MNTFRNRIQENWGTVLEQVLARARTLGNQGVVAFDLDSTLLDNRPRQARIVREYAAARGVGALASCSWEHFKSGWDLREAMQRCGLTPAEAERLYPDLKEFWASRFFTSEYCTDDLAIPGAVDFVRRAVETGAHVTYVTGRHEGMRPGTVEAMRRAGLATPGGMVSLIMKPSASQDDDAFKRKAHQVVFEQGTLVAAFDNEPTHVNDYRREFPEAFAVHLATDHSGRPVELLDGVVSIPHFDAVAGGE